MFQATYLENPSSAQNSEVIFRKNTLKAFETVLLVEQLKNMTALDGLYRTSSEISFLMGLKRILLPIKNPSSKIQARPKILKILFERTHSKLSKTVLLIE